MDSRTGQIYAQFNPANAQGESIWRFEFDPFAAIGIHRVNEMLVQGGPREPLETMSLGRLRDIPLEERCSSLLLHDRGAFEAATRRLEDLRGPITVDMKKLAWAVAFNIGELAEAAAEAGAGRRNAYFRRKDWDLDTQWDAIWSVLTRPLDPDHPWSESTLLSELALSVACEQREDWQPPSDRPIDSALADEAFNFVYRENQKKVLGACKSYVNRLGGAENIAQEAWSRMFSTYWSSRATRRFQGFARISTTVSQIARHIATNEFRDQARFTTIDESPNSDSSNANPSETFDPAERLVSDQLYRRAEQCMSSLPAKRRVVAQMVWLRQIQANRVAQILRVSEAAISQHLKLARAVVGPCLKQHGFHLPC